MKSLLKNIGWAAGISLVIGSLAGTADAIQALRLNPMIVAGRDRVFYFSDVAGFYGLIWAGLMAVFAVAARAVFRGRRSRFSDLSAQVISGSVTLYVYAATVVWFNDRLLPFAVSATSFAGNAAYLALMALLFLPAFFLVRALLSKFRSGRPGRFFRNAALALAMIFTANAIMALGDLGRATLAGVSSNPRPKDAGKVILITLDALRADHLSCYGYRKSQTPSIDSLAQAGYLFRNALSNAPHTYPSFSSMFTSRYAEVSGFCQFMPIPNEMPTLAQLLQGQGIKTGAIISNVFMNSSLNLTRGFSDLYNSFEPGFLPRISATHLNLAIGRVSGLALRNQSSRVLTDKALKWLEKNGNEPFFLWVHYIEPHFPYGDLWVTLTPEPGYNGKLDQRINSPDFPAADRDGELKLTQEDIAHVLFLYDQDTKYADSQIGRLFSFLKESGLWDKSTIILTADHGEEFLEHGHVGHSNYLYWESLHVPLIIKLPGPGRPAEIGAPVELLDLFPTVLDLFRISPPQGIDGQSLLPLMSGGENVHKQYLYGSCNRHQTRQFALRDSRFTLIWHPWIKVFQLFDRESDPSEATDISAQRPEIAKQMLDRLIEIKRRNLKLYVELHPAGTEKARATLDKKKLKALGYVK